MENTKKIFVLIQVTYDYYRFEETLAAFSSQKKAIDETAKMVALDVYLPKTIILDDKESSDQDGMEVNHLWIRKLDLQ